MGENGSQQARAKKLAFSSTRQSDLDFWQFSGLAELIDKYSKNQLLEGAQELTSVCDQTVSVMALTWRREMSFGRASSESTASEITKAKVPR
jgi:hypothetical protein